MSTAVHLLREHAENRPSRRAFLFTDDSGDAGPPTAVTYQELDMAARKVAAAVIDAGAAGKPVLLLYPPGRDYVTGFLGCLYAGALAVPAYPPDPARLGRTLPRLRALITDCNARVALSISGLTEAAQSLKAEAPELADLHWLATDNLPDHLAESWIPPRLDGQTPALLQYTSGSTGTPKGVVLSHANLLHNSELIHQGFQTGPDDIGMSWLPPYHDMGLIGGVLQPIYGGFTTVLMSPLTFLQRPMAWLEAVSTLGVTITGGPNFAFDLCVRKSTPQQRAQLDLSRWSLAFCGAEPVRADTLERFAAAFAPAGFTYQAFYPCYGMAEATLIITGSRRQTPPTVLSHPGGPARRVGCGKPLGGQHLSIVDPGTATPCPTGTVGEIWLSGPSVAQGYWRRPEETEHTFRARLDTDPDRHWLRTGDLGFLDQSGELVVTGRRKDLIIIRGRNIYPQDVERTVESEVPGIRPGCSAAFAVDRGSAERVGIACEIRPDAPEPAELIPLIRQTVAEAHEVNLTTVVLLAPGQIPKTSSGKIQRYACRLSHASGDFSTDVPGVLACWDETEGSSTRQSWSDPADPVTSVVARALEIPAAALDRHAPLTRLGLDSLRAVELRHALETEFGVQVPLSDLLGGTDLDGLAARLAKAPHPEAETAAVASPSSVEPGYESPASEGERALWFVQRFAPGTTAYQISRAVAIHSELDADRLEQALRAVVDRHPALRTCFPDRDGEPVRKVRAWSGPVLARHDVTGLNDAEVRRMVQQEADRPFDLAQGPLLRTALFTRGPADHVLLVSVHHTVTDFWSLSVMTRELLSRYQDPAHRPAALPDLPARPSVTAERLAYWREALRGAPPALDLPTSYPRPKLQSFRGAGHRLRIPADQLRNLDRFARDTGTTRFVALLAGFAASLSRYVGDDVVIGAPTAGREQAATRDQLGYFVNPVPLRIRVPATATFRELALSAQQAVLGALDHTVPFPTLVQTLQPARDPSRPVLTQAMLVLHQAPPGLPDLGSFAVADETGHAELGGLQLRPVPLDPPDCPFDLSLVLAEVAGGLSGWLEYCADLFDPPTAAGLADQLTALLARAVAQPDTPLEDLPVLDGDQRARVAALADRGPVPYPDSTTVHALFSRQAARTPDAVAVVSGTRSLTYAEVDRRSDRLAGLLRGRFAVGRGDLVGLHVGRDNPDLIVAFWGILKSGAAYLPLDPALPRNRLEWILTDASPVTVLTDAAMADRLPDHGRRWCRLDQIDRDGSDNSHLAGDTDVTQVRTDPVTADDLAYVFYTSGSTGRPKGVLVAHRGLCNFGEAFADAFGITGSDRVLQYASYGFDASIAELLAAHLRGAALHLVPPEAVVPGPLLVELLERQRITAAIMSPAALAALPDAQLPHLGRLMSAADTLPADVVARWAGGREFFNGYGPTEITVCATAGRCLPDRQRPPIGSPLDNVRTYVLDHRMRPVPIGVPGELYIGGVGVAWGYLGRPTLTAQRFVPDPFGDRPGARLYRTGDRVRWLADGTLDFLGRTDHQVKIRGVRIEPGEVQARIAEMVQPREVAVVARPRPGHGDPELVAYLVADRQRPSVVELRGLLRAELPEPLVPAAFVYLDRLPRTPGGKLDRLALPGPGPADRGISDRVAPRTDLERTVAQVWAAALGHDSVGLRDHFFEELGGSSLTVAKVTAELGRRLGRDVPVTHLFEHPTVESLVSRLQAEPESTGTDTTTAEDHRAHRVATARREALARRRNRRQGT